MHLTYRISGDDSLLLPLIDTTVYRLIGKQSLLNPPEIDPLSAELLNRVQHPLVILSPLT